MDGVSNLNLKINASAKRVCQLRPRPKPVLANGLLKHQLGSVALQISEALFGAGVQNAKAKQLRIEAKAFREIRTNKFGD
jgi:hypothetical protein